MSVRGEVGMRCVWKWAQTWRYVSLEGSDYCPLAGRYLGSSGLWPPQEIKRDQGWVILPCRKRRIEWFGVTLASLKRGSEKPALIGLLQSWLRISSITRNSVWLATSKNLFLSKFYERLALMVVSFLKWLQCSLKSAGTTTYVGSYSWS